MGLFADSIDTVVSSTVYNMAGDENSQPDQLKSAIIGTILGDREDLSEAISRTYTQGTVVSQRRFLNYMTTSHPTYLISGSVNSFADVNASQIQTELETQLGLTGSQTARIAAAKIDVGEIDYWAEDWVRKNHPTLERSSWFAEYDKDTDEIVITIPGPVVVRLAASADLLWATAAHSGVESRKLLYVAYTVVDPGDALTQGTEGSIELYVYRMGSGNVTFDALSETATAMTEFYPALPLRLRNKSIRHADYTSELAVVTPAYRKLTRQKIDGLLDTIEANANIDDIDYAFLVQGVPLNTENHVAKEYLFKFLSDLKDTQTYSKTDYDTYQTRVQEAEASRLAWERYLHRQESGSVFYAEAPPTEPQEVANEPPLNTFEIAAPALENLRQRLSWAFMEVSTQSGNCNRFDGDANRTKAKQGEYHIHVGTPYQYKTRYWNQSQGEDSNEGEYIWITKDLPRIFFCYQIDPFTYTRLEVAGFQHENFVYKQEAVLIKAEDAMAEVDPTGFLVPLHAPTFTELGMSKQTRMSSSVSHIVFNSYERVRTRWYQKTVFQILLVIAGAALSVLIPGLGGMAASGILGSNLAVGVSLGMTTALSAAVAGAVANALAAMVVTTVISEGASGIFGEKIGAVIGTIATFAAMNYTSTLIDTGSFNIDWGRMFAADNILQLTSVAGNAYMKFLAADTMELYGEMGELEEGYAEEMKEIQDLMANTLGRTGVELDPMEITDVMFDFGESSETFLSRTLLTGTDVVRISHNMISDFTEISLKLPEAFV